MQADSEIMELLLENILYLKCLPKWIPTQRWSGLEGREIENIRIIDKVILEGTKNRIIIL